MIQENGTVKYLVISLLLILWTSTSSAVEAPQPPNAMHPAFKLLDGSGQIIMKGERKPDQIRTCGQCHSTDFIQGHNLPAHRQANVTCIACHYEGGSAKWSADAFAADGAIKREWIRISKPSNSNCTTCHGLGETNGAPVSVPLDYRISAYPGSGDDKYRLTRSTGSIYSSQGIDTSLLNFSGKQGMAFPWDVHARKMLKCADCHFAPNNPRHPAGQAGEVAGLREEPRQGTIGEYLKEPDHRFSTANCQTCHDPKRGHSFLPYPERHFQAVACESCHIPKQFAPAEQMVDATLLDESGSPPVEYRGAKTGSSNLNTALSRGFEPPLAGIAVEKTSGANAKGKATPTASASSPALIRPVNTVSVWYWASGDSSEPVPREMLQQALIKDGRFRPELITALDMNHDGRLDRSELKLDTESKRRTVERLLAAAGVRDPVIRSDASVHKISHGVAPKSRAISDCAACHGPDSRLAGGWVLASHAPGGVPPTWKGDTPAPGRIAMDKAGRVVLSPGPGASQSNYVFGFTSNSLVDRAGLLMLAGVLLAVALHGGFRAIFRRRAGKSDQIEISAAGRPRVEPTARQYLFSAYERTWHWVMAFSVLALIFTGIQIHFPGGIHLLGTASLVSTHNFFGAVLAINAFLALFHHLTTAGIRQFLPGGKGFADEVKAQARYYLSDIFRGLPTPFKPSRERKLNVLQQITYLCLLNVLFPFQIITGAMIWLVGKSPDFAAAVGGLGVVAPLHNLGSWMFLSFLAAHLYLATTGRTLFSHIHGMIDGYEEVARRDSGRPYPIVMPGKAVGAGGKQS